MIRASFTPPKADTATPRRYGIGRWRPPVRDRPGFAPLSTVGAPRVAKGSGVRRRFQARPRLQRATRSAGAEKADRETHWRSLDASAGVRELRRPAGRRWHCSRQSEGALPVMSFRAQRSDADRYDRAADRIACCDSAGFDRWSIGSARSVRRDNRKGRGSWRRPVENGPGNVHGHAPAKSRYALIPEARAALSTPHRQTPDASPEKANQDRAKGFR